MAGPEYEPIVDNHSAAYHIPSQDRSAPDAAASVTDDEYEYEYSADETETHYILLDLTTHAALPSTGSASETRKTKSKQTPAVSKSSSRSTGPIDTALSHSSTQQQQQQDQLQILALDSARPVIRLNNAVYACDWSTDLGTQIHLSPAGDVEHASKKGRVVDIIGVSRVRLTGRPATLRPRARTDSDASQPAASATTTPAPAVVDTEVKPSNEDAPTGPGAVFAAVKASTSDPALAAQASFLQRLAEIKKQKGETDVIPVRGVKRYDVQKAREAKRARNQ